MGNTCNLKFRTYRDGLKSQEFLDHHFGIFSGLAILNVAHNKGTRRLLQGPSAGPFELHDITPMLGEMADVGLENLLEASHTQLTIRVRAVSRKGQHGITSSTAGQGQPKHKEAQQHDFFVCFFRLLGFFMNGRSKQRHRRSTAVQLRFLQERGHANGPELASASFANDTVAAVGIFLVLSRYAGLVFLGFWSIVVKTGLLVDRVRVEAVEADGIFEIMRSFRILFSDPLLQVQG